MRSGSAADWLIVGLGNPGEEYIGTRHNIGAEVVAALASRHGARLKFGKERSLSCEVRVGEARMALAFPQTFMNISGEAVRLLVKRHGIVDLATLVVVHDELDLACGAVKLKFGGGLAGHNGLKSIASHLHTPDFSRVRIGIGRPTNERSVSDYVLTRPGKADRVELDLAVVNVVEGIEKLAEASFDAVMNVMNTGGVR